MNTPEKRRLLRKWEKQRLALQSKIQQVLENRDSEEVAIKRFTIDWENAGLNLYSTENLGGKTNEQRRLVKEAARKCQPEISELAMLVDREIKHLGFNGLDKAKKVTLPECSLEANRALAGMRN